MFNASAFHVAAMPHGVADHVWHSDAKSFVTASYRSEGALDRGRRLTGRWRSVAGCRRADWLLLTADAGGVPSYVLVPRHEAIVEPVADQTGLLDADVCDVTVSDLPVPEQRIIQTPCGGAALVAGAGAAAAVVGSADGVWRSHVAQVRERLTASYGTEEVTDRMSSTAQVARAASDIDAAKLQIAASIQRDDLRAAVWAHRQAAVRARDAADQLLGSSRRHALDASDPMTRLWRDVHAGTRLALRLLDALDPG
jgi:3-hydroxy-9,10-secoandrosta-1,3,5(10)-triene-9,17-dione monooxygenase